MVEGGGEGLISRMWCVGRMFIDDRSSKEREELGAGCSLKTVHLFALRDILYALCD